MSTYKTASVARVLEWGLADGWGLNAERWFLSILLLSSDALSVATTCRRESATEETEGSRSQAPHSLSLPLPLTTQQKLVLSKKSI